MTKRRALGKGLRALIPEKSEILQKPEDINTESIEKIDINSIEPNKYQPRNNFNNESLIDLAQSIKSSGIIQPLVVKKTKDNKYELIAGERRLRAAKIAGLKSVPVIQKAIDKEEMLALALIENIQREDLNIVDEAAAYKKLLDQFKYTHEDISRKVGKSRSAVTNSLRMLKLPEKILNGLKSEKITAGHSRAILALDTEEEQFAMFDLIVRNNLSVRQVEEYVKDKKANNIINKEQTKPEKEKIINPELQRIEEDLQEYFGTKVIINNNKNKGKIVIDYYSIDDFDRIINKLRK